MVWLSEVAQTKIPDEKRQMRLGYVYLKQNDQSGRHLTDDRIILVKQDQEPPEFTDCFPSWN